LAGDVDAGVGVGVDDVVVGEDKDVDSDCVVAGGARQVLVAGAETQRWVIVVVGSDRGGCVLQADEGTVTGRKLRE
jgi:hypothetical protein